MMGSLTARYAVPPPRGGRGTSNPNDDPQAHFSAEAKYVPTKAVVLQDVSGSQNETELLRWFSSWLDTLYTLLGPGTTVVPFGFRDTLHISYDGWQLAYTLAEFQRHYRDNGQNTMDAPCTSTYLIAKHLESMARDSFPGPYVLVLEGDGEFDSPARVPGAVTFADMLRRPEVQPALRKVAQVYLVLSPHTSADTEKKLMTDVRAVLDTVPCRFIDLRCARLAASNGQPVVLPGFMKTAAAVTAASSAAGTMTFYKNFSWHRDLVPAKLALLFAKHGAIPMIVADLTRTIELSPDLLGRDDGNVYATLYAVIKVATQQGDPDAKAFMDWLAAYNSTRKLPAITALLLRTAQLPSLIKEARRKAAADCVGFMAPLHKDIPPAEVAEALRDGTGAQLIALQKRANMVFVEEGDGMPVPADLSDGAKVRDCFALFFQSYGDFTVTGSNLLILAMAVLSSDEEFDPRLIDMASAVMFGCVKPAAGEADAEALLGILGTDPAAFDPSKLAPRWFGASLAVLLHRFFTLHGDKYPAAFADVINHVKLIHAVMRYHKQLARELPTDKTTQVTRTLREPTSTGRAPRTGDVVRIMPVSWTSKKKVEPRPDLPSIALVIAVKTNKLHVRFLDRKMDGKDDCRGIRAIHVRIVATDLSEKSAEVADCNRLLMDWAADEAALSPPQQQQLHDARLADIERELSRTAFGYVTEEKKIPVSAKVIDDILGVPPLLRHGKAIRNNPYGMNRDAIAAVLMDPDAVRTIRAPSWPERHEPFTFLHGDHTTVVLTEEEVRALRTRFFELLVGPSVVGSVPRIYTCGFCFEDRKLEQCIHPACGHPVCRDAGDCLRPATLEVAPGDFLDDLMHRCRCPFRCEGVLPLDKMYGNTTAEIAAIVAAIGRGEEDPETIYRFCEECRESFPAGERTCGGDPDALPRCCETCLVRKGIATGRPVKCPNCEVDLEHSGGCLHFVCCARSGTRCEGASCSHRLLGRDGGVIAQGCGTHFCVKCQLVFPNNGAGIYDHECFGDDDAYNWRGAGARQ